MGSGNRGLTISEILVALALFAVAALALIGVFTGLLVKSSIESDTAAARILADSVLSRAKSSEGPDWGVPGGFGEARIATGDSNSATTFLYRLEVEELEEHDLGAIHRFRVEVEWESSGETREKLEQTTLHYDG